MDNEFIKQLDSSTVRAALIIIVANIFALIKAFTNLDFDLDFIKLVTEQGVNLGISALTILAGYKAYKGRLGATKKIEGAYAEKIRNSK